MFLSDAQSQYVNRRTVLRSASALAGLSLLPGRKITAAGDESSTLRVAAIITEFTYRSHAHVILENFLKPYLFNGQWTDPGMQVVSMYVDQFPDERDMARGVSAEFNIPIYPTIAAALCAGEDRLSVDAVLSIGEHGKYPYNEKGQHLYPRKRFFDEIVAEMQRSGRFVPLFSDKHLSCRWDWAKEMYDTAASLGIPLMAGSSVPLAQRWPQLEIPSGIELEAAVSIHGGGVESYDFHGLEVMQSLVEFRQGAEQGIETVQFLTGEQLWNAAGEQAWPVDLAHAAMAAELGPGQPPLPELVARLTGDANKIHGVLVSYRDGLRGVVLAVGGRNRWNFACRAKGASEPMATTFYVGPWENRNLFKALSHAIQTHFRQRQAPYPVERTLLVTGVVDAAMQSRHDGGTTISTPHLAISYEPVDSSPMREMGATWRIITEGMPEPRGIDPGGGTPT